MRTYTARFSGTVNTGPRGRRIMQCPLCRELFSGEAPFVWHRITGSYPTGNAGQYYLGRCRDPATVGMTLSDSAVWGRRAVVDLAES